MAFVVEEKPKSRFVVEAKPRFVVEDSSLPRYNKGEIPEGGFLGQAYQKYRAFPPVQRFNTAVARIPQAIREKFLPETPTLSPTGQVNRINVPLETLKGTARETAASFLNFDTDVIAGLIAAGPTFRMLGGLTTPTGVSLKEVFGTPLGRNFFQRAFLPKQIQAQSVQAVQSGFRPESVLIPQERVTVEEAAEAAKQGAAHILSERPLGPEEILELYKIRYGLTPEPTIPSPVVPQLREAFRKIDPLQDLGKSVQWGEGKGILIAVNENRQQAHVRLLEPPPWWSKTAKDEFAKYSPKGEELIVPLEQIQISKGPIPLPAPSAFGKLLKQQMLDVEQTPLHPAKAGRAALKKIFGDQAGFVALPEDEDILNGMLAASKLAGAQVTAKFAENINLSRINDTSLRAAMQDYIDQRPGVATTPHITNEELIKRASYLKDTPIIKQIAMLPEGTLESEALRNRQESLGVIQKTLENTMGESFKSEMDVAIQQYRKPASVFARALQAQSIPAEARQGLLSVLDKRMVSILKDPILGRDPELIGKLKRLRTDLAGTDVLTPDALDKLYFVWLNSILSNPLTHAVNRLSNFAFRWAKIPERFFQAAVDVPVSMVTGERTSFFGEIPAMLRGLREKPSIPIAPGTKMDIYRGYNPFGTGRGAKVLALPTELLQKEDEISKRLIGQMELYAQVYRESAKLGAKGADAKIAEQMILANPSSALMSRVAKEQLYRTFQDAPSIIGEVALGARAKFKPLRYIIPFVRTPDRIAHAAFIERTPVQLANIGRKWFLWKNIGKDYSQEEFTKDLSLLSTSGAVAWWAGYHYLKGNITGDAPTNPGERAAFYAQGKKANAFKLGPYWIPFNRVEPWGTALSVAVNFVQDFQQSDKEAPTDKVLQAIGGVAQTLTNKTYLSGLTNFIKAMSDPEQSGSKFSERAVAGFIPGISGLAAQLQNPYYLNPQGVRESVMSRIPVLSKQVPKRLGRFAEPQQRTVLDIGKEDISRVDGELNRLGHVIGFPSKSLGSHKLSNTEYNELQEMAGPLSYKTIDTMIRHPAYQVLSDEEKIKEIDAVIDEDREAARERMRIRIISRELQKSKTPGERKVTLGKLKDEKVLTKELYFEFKTRGLIP